MDDLAEDLEKIKIKLGSDAEKYFPPCTGCGACCLEAPCTLAVHLHLERIKKTGECPELFWSESEKKYRCSLAAHPLYAKRLYIGAGCGFPLNSWRKDVKKRF